MRRVIVLILVPSIFGLKDPQVRVPQSTIEGSTAWSLNGRKFFTFEGIPYALPPVGEYRFEKPVPSQSWNGTWHAKTVHKCLQYDQYALQGQDPVTGEEDCLYLNIYTPSLDPKSKLDVIVYIHGGAFMFLYGAFYGPKFLLDRDVVFINLNYRLGPLGFLTTESDLVPGNNGIRDQILALKWIKKNVEYFGGNPDSVTIFGMSAGGASVHTHYLSPLSDGLFHRGFSQSGTTLNPWVLMEGGLEKTRKLGANVGCLGEIDEVVKCLKARPGKQIVGSVKIFLPWLYNPFSPFGLVVDSWSKDPVLPEHPLSLLHQGRVKDLPWVLSMTDFEGLYPASDFLEDRYLQEIETRWNELLPFILDYNYTVDLDLQNEISQKIKKWYLEDRKLDQNSLNTFIQILSDRLFGVGIYQTARLQSKSVKSDIFFYLFKYRGAHTWYESFAKPRKDFGASHAEDTAYLLSTPTADPTTTKEDRNMVKFFVDFITSFAKNGVPEVGTKWRPVSKDGGNFEGLVINSAEKVAMEEILVKSEEFWESLPIKENNKLIKKLRDEL